MTVLIGIRHTRDFEGTVVDALWNLRRPPEGATLRRMPGLRTDDAANRLVLVALNENASHLLFWDSDQCPPKGALLRMLERDVDIVGCLTFGRLWPHWPVSLAEERARTDGNHRYAVDVEETNQYLSRYRRLFPTERFQGALLPKDDPGAFVERAALGLAFTLVKTDVFRKLIPDWENAEAVDVPKWFHSTDGIGREDVYFTDLAKNAGYKLWMDRSVVVGHGYGDQHIGPMDFLAFKQYLITLPADERERVAKIGME